MICILTDEKAIQLYNEYYVNGYSTVKLAEMFGHTHHYYLDKFKEMGFPIRNNKEKSRKYTANFTYFNEIDSHEKAYWLGFIYADGYVSDTQNKKLFGISLARKDKHQIEKLNLCLDSNYPINDYVSTNSYKENTEYSRLIIIHDELFNGLTKHGVVPHKTAIIERPNIEEKYYPSFILGYFDGDGSIFLNKSKRPFYSVNIVGTDDLLSFIHNCFVNNNVTGKTLKLEKRKQEQTVSYIRYGGNAIVSKIMEYIYSEIDIQLPLERKRELFSKCKSRIFE